MHGLNPPTVRSRVRGQACDAGLLAVVLLVSHQRLLNHLVSALCTVAEHTHIRVERVTCNVEQLVSVVLVEEVLEIGKVLYKPRRPTCVPEEMSRVRMSD